jgi:hypothetical protein
MRSSVRFWLALSFLLVAGGIVLWLKGRPEKSREAVAWSQAQGQPQPTATKAPALLSAPSVTAALGQEPAKPETASEKAARYQLKNVDQPIEALTRVDSAILMRNALIDTRQPVELPIPADLRAGENPGAYIVQAASAPTAEFQNALKSAGAQIVAYVPNNAFLVKAGSEVAANLQSVGGVRSVLPYEPYYKLDTRLMKFAVDHESMADDAWLRITLFPGVTAGTVTALAQSVGPTEKSPFGQQILIQPRPGVLADIAQLAQVQIIEPLNPRVAANDLTRVRLGVSTDTITNANHLGLSGADVWVNLNDFGVQSNHTALKGRVSYYGTNGAIDIEGHGTHVAGTIIGNHATNIFDKIDFGTNGSARTNIVISSDEDGNTTTNLYIDGSLKNADFRGIAHEAKLFVLPIDYDPDLNQPVTDTYLIETAARTNYFTFNRTNETLISNNSWNYLNSAEYDSQAARFDAATRDALPDNRGEQPVLYVFAAGNLGFGSEDGQGGQPGTIASPGTAKNVITVGALESPRFIAEPITNIEVTTITDDDGTTHSTTNTTIIPIFRPATDSDNQVASYSSRGNVGIGIEGAAGRFKPDLVAPGTFIMSARSTNWNLKNDFDPTNPDLTNLFNVLSNLNSVSTEYRYDTGTSFAAPGVSGMLALVQEFFSHRLPVDRRRNLSPALMKALLLNAARSVNSVYDWNKDSQPNFQGWGLTDLRTLITASELTPGRATLEDWQESDWPLQLIEQSPTNAVATGEERVWTLTMDTNALTLPLRFTLVWTDPPGNPQVGVKLVNDLDLTVEVAGRVFHGNDFPSGLQVTEPRDPLPAGQLAIDDPNRDSINNVEKIVIGNPSSLFETNGLVATTYKVKVSGRRVNVKAVNDFYKATGGTNEIVQDFALVMSADNYFDQKPFKTIARDAKVTVNKDFFVQPVYNGVEATNQRAGANSPLYWTNGNAMQWRFYAFTNLPNTNGIITNVGRYVAFITSGPLNVAKQRNLEPDVDIYVSKDSRLTNLEPTVISNAWKSTTRLGTEQVVFAPDIFIYTRDASGRLVATTNTVDQYDPQHPELGGVIVGQADIGDVFYVGVKAEDQQAGEFSFIAISSQDPLEEDRNGIRIIHMLPAPSDIPDGVANLPAGRRYHGIPMRGGKILDASVYFQVNHQELGDLVGVVGQGSRYAILNNHSLPDGFTDPLSIIYSSNPYVPIDAQGHYINDPLAPEYPPALYSPPFAPPSPLVFRPDGPTDLSTFLFADAMQHWTLDMFDSAGGQTGSVNQAEIHVVPYKKPLIGGEVIDDTVGIGQVKFYPLDVPIDASRVTLTLTIKNGGADTNLVMLVGRDVLPSSSHFDYIATFTPGGPTTITLSFDRNSIPPLIPGEYVVAIANFYKQNEAGAKAFDYTLAVTIDRDNSGRFRDTVGDSFISTTDNARTISARDYQLDRIVTDASVAILAPDIRESDYVFRLTSPQGTSVILSENRGWFDQAGFGSFLVTTNGTNVFPGPTYAVFTDDLGSLIKFTPPPFGDSATTRGFAFGSSFENALEGTYVAPATLDGWTVRTNEVYAVWGDAADGQIFVNLGLGGAISNTLPTIKGRPYKLSFSYRGKPKLSAQTGRVLLVGRAQVGQVFSTGQIDSNDDLGTHINAPAGSADRHFRIVYNPDPNYAPAPGQDGSTLFVAMTNTLPFPGWFANDTNSQWLAMLPQNDDGHPIGNYTNRTSFVLTGIDPARVTVQGRIASDDRGVSILRNGVPQTVLVASSPTAYSQSFGIQGFKTGLNTIDFVIQNTAIGDEGFRAHLLMTVGITNKSDTNLFITNVATAGFLRLTSTNGTPALFSVSGAPEWQRFETEFIAPSDNIGIEFFAGATNFPGVDIDDIELLDTGTKFMLPEEPLALLKDERAMGEWKLEAIDNRTGDVLSDFIWDWQLILGVTPSPRLAEALANTATYPTTINNPVIQANTNVYSPGKILGGEIEYFYFDVCSDATEATITLFGPKTNSIGIELLVDRSGFPTGDPDRDDYEVVRTTPGKDSTVTFKLTTDQPVAAPLRPGKRLFMAVRGAQFPQTTNETFTIRVDSNGGCSFTPPPKILNAGESVSSASFAGGPGDPGDRYQTTTTAASSVEFTTDGGTLTILASNGVEPTMSNYQIKQTVSSSKVKILLPTAGTWYFRIVNESGQTVPYTLSVEGQPTSAINSVTVADNHLTVTWQSEPGASYEIATSTDLVNWTVTTTVQAESTQTSYTDPDAVSGAAKFIRIRKL